MGYLVSLNFVELEDPGINEFVGETRPTLHLQTGHLGLIDGDGGLFGIIEFCGD